MGSRGYPVNGTAWRCQANTGCTWCVVVCSTIPRLHLILISGVMQRKCIHCQFLHHLEICCILLIHYMYKGGTSMVTKLMQGDCLERMRDIEDSSVDMLCVDLPHGTTQNKWDSIISLDKLFVEYKRIVKIQGAMVFFLLHSLSQVLL